MKNQYSIVAIIKDTLIQRFNTPVAWNGDEKFIFLDSKFCGAIVEPTNSSDFRDIIIQVAEYPIISKLTEDESFFQQNVIETTLGDLIDNPFDENNYVDVM